MKSFDYYKMANVWEIWEQALWLYIPLLNNEFPEKDSVRVVDNILEWEWEKKAVFCI